MKTTSTLAGIFLIMLFAAGAAYLVFYAPGLCADDAVQDITDRGSQEFRINHARVTVLGVNGSIVNCTCRNRNITFVVGNHSKRGLLLPGRSYEVDYAATRYPNGTEVHIISRIYTQAE